MSIYKYRINLFVNYKVSPSTINNAREYARINGAGGVQLFSPRINKKSTITFEMQKQFGSFFADKANVSMSSYKVYPITNKPILYLQDQKESLCNKFSETYPNGIKRTTLLKQIKDDPFIYREDLG